MDIESFLIKSHWKCYLERDFEDKKITRIFLSAGNLLIYEIKLLATFGTKLTYGFSCTPHFTLS